MGHPREKFCGAIFSFHCTRILKKGEFGRGIRCTDSFKHVVDKGARFSDLLNVIKIGWCRRVSRETLLICDELNGGHK